MVKTRPLVKKSLKIAGIVLAVLLVIMLVLVVAIQQPGVQSFLVRKVAGHLSQKLATKVEVKRVDFRFVKSLVMQGVYVEDLEQDTLVYAKEVDVKIHLFSVFSQELSIGGISVDSAVVKVRRDRETRQFNFQPLVDAMKGKAPKPKTPTLQGKIPRSKEDLKEWKFALQKLALDNVRVEVDDEMRQEKVTKFFGEFEMSFRALLPQQKQVKLKHFVWKDSYLYFHKLKWQDYSDSIAMTRPASPPAELISAEVPQPPQKEEPIADSIVASSPTQPYSPKPSPERIKLPDIPWVIAIEQAEVSNNFIRYEDENQAPIEGHLDPNHIWLQEISASVQDVSFQDLSFHAQVEQASLQEKYSGFELENFSGEISLDSTQLSLQNILFQSGKTYLATNTTVQYPSYDSLLMDWKHSVEVDAELDTSYINMEEMLMLAFPLRNDTRINHENKEIIQLEGKVAGNVAKLEGHGTVRTGKHTLAKANFILRKLTDSIPALHINLDTLSTHHQDLRAFTGERAEWDKIQDLGVVQLSGKVRGDLADLRLSPFSLKTESYTKGRFFARIQNIQDKENIQYDFDLKQLQTHYEDVEQITGRRMPTGIQKMGTLNLAGSLNGTRDRMHIKKMHFLTDSKTGYLGEIQVRGLSDLDKVKLNMNIQSFETAFDDLEGITPPKILKLFKGKKPFETVLYEGHFTASKQVIEWEGRVRLVLPGGEAEAAEKDTPSEPEQSIFYVILGSFDNKTNALEEMKIWEKRGIHPTLIPHGIMGYRLSFRQYLSRKYASKAAATLNKKYGTDVWVLEM